MHLNSGNRISNNILETIGNTPLIRLNKIPEKYGIKCEILAKCEFFNPSSSLKDRISLRMIENAEKNGTLKPGYVCIVPTSGNTGISMALAAGAKGYKCIIVMSEKMSKEKESIIRALGSGIVRTPISGGSFGPNGIFSAVDKLTKQYPESVVLNQYTDPGNPDSHYDTTAEEILNQCNGKLDMFVMGTGTGGTLTGVALKLKQRLPNIKIVGVDPVGSILAEPKELNMTDNNFFELEGIGHDFVPEVLDRSIVDFWVKSRDKDSLLMSRELIKEEGLLCGMSSGAVTSAAIEAAKDLRKDQRVVVLFGDGIRNYMTKFIQDDWMLIRDFIPTDRGETICWWNQEVLNLHLDNKYTITEDIKVEEVISYMNRMSINQVALVQNCRIKGVLTKQHILNKIISQDIHTSDKVSTILIKNYNKVYQTTTIGVTATMLKTDNFLVVLTQKKSSQYVGVVTVDDILNYVNK